MIRAAPLRIQDLLEREANGLRRLCIGQRRSGHAGQPRGGARPGGDRSALVDRTEDHSGSGREVRRGIDQDEAARGAIVGVAVEDQRSRGRDSRGADLIQHETVVDFGGHGARRMFQQVDARRIERPLIHPDNLGFEPLPDVDLAGRQDITAADVELVFEHQRDGHGRVRQLEVTVPGGDAGDARRPARRPGGDRVAAPHRARHDLPGVSAEVVRRAQHELHREPERFRRDVSDPPRWSRGIRAGSVPRTMACARSA